MKKPLLWVLVAAAAALAVIFAVTRGASNHHGTQVDTVDTSAVKNLTITIDGQAFAMHDGVAEIDAVPGSAAKNTLKVVGEPVTGDVSGDGAPEAALLVRNDPGGSGVFYYAVLAFADGGSYRATNAVLLGDRIAPQGIDVTDGKFVYRYLGREPREPMSADPSVQTSLAVSVDPASGQIAVRN